MKLLMHAVMILVFLSANSVFAQAPPKGPAPAPEPAKGTIKVTFQELKRDRGGNLIVGLYQEDTWLQPEQALMQKTIPVLKEGGVEAVFTAVPYAESYGIHVLIEK